MGFEVVEFSVLKVFKVSVQELMGLAEHYYLGETSSLHNLIGWVQTGWSCEIRLGLLRRNLNG